MESLNGNSQQSFGNKESEIPAPLKKEKVIHYSSVLSEDKFSYTWKIHDFNEIPFISGYPIYSPTFIINKKTNCLWQIVMTKHAYNSDKGDTSDNEEGDISDSDCDDEPIADCDCKTPKSVEIVKEKSKRIGLRLLKIDESLIWDVVNYTFTVKIADGTTVTTTAREEPGQIGFRGVPVYAFLSEKDFGDSKLFDEKYLEVTCDIKYSYIDGSAPESPVSYEGKRFVPDLRLLYVTNKFCDLSVNSDGGELRAHKVVLHAGIPGFEKLLKEEGEQQKSKFDLEVDSEVGKAMVKFMYSGEIEDGFPVEKCMDLYEAARKYGVDCLDQYCSKYFENNLPSDVCRICLGIGEGVLFSLESVKKLGAENIKNILSKAGCSHKN